MATKKTPTSSMKYPIEVYLKSNNPYHNKVVCNGIIVSTDFPTLITNDKMMGKLKNIEKWIIIKNI